MDSAGGVVFLRLFVNLLFLYLSCLGHSRCNVPLPTFGLDVGTAYPLKYDPRHALPASSREDVLWRTRFCKAEMFLA